MFVWYLEIGFICQQIIINPQATTSLQQKSHSQKRSQMCQEIFGWINDLNLSSTLYTVTFIQGWINGSWSTDPLQNGWLSFDKNYQVTNRDYELRIFRSETLLWISRLNKHSNPLSRPSIVPSIVCNWFCAFALLSSLSLTEKGRKKASSARYLSLSKKN